MSVSPLHGSGPGVTGWANWRLTIPALAVHHLDPVRRLVLMGTAGLEFELTPGLDAVWGYEPSREIPRDLIRLFAHGESLANEDLVEMRSKAGMRPGVEESHAGMFPAPRQNGIRLLAQTEDCIAALPH